MVRCNHLQFLIDFYPYPICFLLIYCERKYNEIINQPYEKYIKEDNQHQ